jgi:LDH2 family malate/lactate/ureidoglycolate dehydrogenase
MAGVIVIQAPLLKRFIEHIFVAAGVPASSSGLLADSLVAANLRGVDSHGVQLAPPYFERISSGDIDPRAEGRVISEDGCCLLYDGANGIGQQIARVCSEHAVRIASRQGMAAVSARDSNHFGAAAYWAQSIAAAGQVGIVMCNASTIVPPWQGREPRLGTNPLCMAAPGPWLLDMATTTVAMNKVYKAHMDGYSAIPAGWALDTRGVPTTDPAEAIQGMPMPLGGYKGSGLGMMVEIFCSVISGGAMRDQVGGIRVAGQPSRASQFFLAIDVERFMPVAEFTARLEALVRFVKSSAPAPGYEEVLVAGDPEWRMEEERLRSGIPLGQGTWDALAELARRLAVAVPHLSPQ